MGSRSRSGTGSESLATTVRGQDKEEGDGGRDESEGGGKRCLSRMCLVRKALHLHIVVVNRRVFQLGRDWVRVILTHL